MPLKRTHYEILGVSRTATPEQIKKRYRQLVRKYHPDVAEDKAVARSAFLQISEAYQTLSDPDRRMIYDAELDMQIAGPTPRAARQGTPPSGGASGGFTTGSTSSRRRNEARSAERLIRDAKAAMARRQYWVALDCARDAVNADRRSVEAHIVLGDVYMMQNRQDEAASVYTVAVQLDPENVEAAEKLDKATRRSRKMRFSDANVERMQAFKTGVTLISGSVGAFMLILLAMAPGEPISWLKEHLPFVASWSPMLVFVLLGAGGLAGFLMSMTDLVGPLDDELVFQMVSGGRLVSYPIGLILVILNLFSFYVAAAIYLFAGLIQDAISRSIVKSFVATVCVLAIVGVIYTPGTREVLIWGGNLVFPAMLFGWTIGDFVKPWG